jgi:2-haloacid dehalogenase
MAPENDIFTNPPRALAFDVFGTVVDWRETVTATLMSSAAAKTSSSSRSAELPPAIRLRLSQLTDLDWARFAQDWRDSYKHFVASFVPGETPWRDIDAHHLLSLRALLESWGLAGLYTDDEVAELSLVWHALTPWADSATGLRLLNTRFVTSTLSNGNLSLLADLAAHGGLGFARLQSAEDFHAYKPHASVYLGAAAALGMEPREVAMVAAHLKDLKAARACGYRTIYVEREGEEDWEEYEEARGWVDVWVTKGEEGLVEVARRFGIE